MLEGYERLLKAGHRLPVGGLRGRLGSCLPKVEAGLCPALASEGMMGEPVDLVGEAVTREGFQRLHDLCMQHPPPLQEEAAIGHLVREGVLKGVLALGKEPGLVEELGRLEVGQAAMQVGLG